MKVHQDLEKTFADARAEVESWPEWMRQEYTKVEKSLPSPPPVTVEHRSSSTIQAEARGPVRRRLARAREAVEMMCDDLPIAGIVILPALGDAEVTLAVVETLIEERKAVQRYLGIPDGAMGAVNKMALDEARVATDAALAASKERAGE